MYKVIVADDEPLMLEGWRTMIDWAGCGYELCGLASDGEEALEMFGTVKPDLVVTDIRMPGLDGLELIRAIRGRKDSHARSIVVSGYAEFAYAQQALRFGVDRYVLKPIVTEEIHDVLHELSALLDLGLGERFSAEEFRAAKAEAQALQLLREGCTDASARDLLGLSARSVLCVALVELRSASAADESGRKSARAGARLAADGLRASNTPVWIFEDCPGRAGLIAACEPGFLERRLKALLESFPGLSVYTGGGEAGYVSLPKLYRRALAVRERALPFGRAGLYRHAEFEAFEDEGFAESIAWAEQAIARVEAGEPESAAQAVSELFRSFERRSASAGWIETINRHIAGELLRRKAEAEAGSAKPAVDKPDADEHFRAPATEAELRRRCGEEAERIRQSRLDAENAPMREAADYVRLHYRDKLRLRELAGRFHLNPVYFGQRFKRETGYGFNDYVHLLRAEEARRLLRRTDMKMSEIGRLLGYHDTEYFTVKFKASTGELPSSYRARERAAER
ncbi:response regulator [Saccharibacillus sp. CPCC 101409]|uniref:response regulator transcription factor n=1 Tax=Saccharibacillus sp. CPCC 101409 TaxID=3058041 RepID=UPI002670DB64|nr:response regulator [Saccharibacillus sp. CPCC 101409]MDO3412316.1 response regulator [Saccharibacillus sp. CPCC 101409]